jgi:hypothetical protein
VEGTRAYTAGLGGLTGCMAMTPATACVPPQDTYAHGGDASVTGGLVPSEGCGWGAHENKYFFGDYARGLLWTLDLRGDRSGAVAGSRAVFATLPGSGIVSFRMGPDGAMYVAAHEQGLIKRIAPRNVPSTCNAGAPGAGAGGTGGAAGAGGAAGTATTPPPGDSGGCSYSLSRRQSGGFAFGALLLLAFLLGRRRRR